MKNLLALGLSVLLAFSLTACGGPDAEVPPPSDSVSPSPEQSDTPAPVEPSVSPSPASSPSSAPVPAPDQFVFTRSNFPKLDGSTSTVPLAEAVASVLLGESRADVADLISFSKTTQSYRALISGDADLLLAAEPAQAIWEEKKAADFDWNMEPFAIDGLIFVVNANNPVDSLTVEQVQKIYTGEYTNWSQVGGDDVEIVPFQRNAEAGSQTMFLKLVMDGLTPMDPPKSYVQLSMFGLVEAVRGYADSTGAIGYTVYYYANDMKMADGLKILRIEGAEPGNESFRSGSYPFTSPYYVTIPAGLPEDDPAQVLFNWILCPEGQRLVAHEGYVPVSEVDAP